MRNSIKSILLALIAGSVALPASAAYYDNFEDGNTLGWLAASSGGLSSNGVQLHNGSQMAYVSHTGSGGKFESNLTSSSLSNTFAYSANELLSFSLHAQASTGRSCCGPIDAGSGVRVTFLNTFNVALGQEGFYYYTNPGLLGANEHQIDNVQVDYSATMATFADYAGLTASAPIAKVSLTFLAWAKYSGGGNIYPDGAGAATVWFDNVRVSAVPEPSTYALMIGGLVMVLARRYGTRRLMTTV